MHDVICTTMHIITCITAMLNHVFLSFSAVQIYALSYIHFYSSPSMGILQTHNVTAPSWLDSSVGTAFHGYRRGHEFKSHSGLNLFQVLISQPLKLCVCVTAMINHKFIFFSAVQIYDLSYSFASCLIH